MLQLIAPAQKTVGKFAVRLWLVFMKWEVLTNIIKKTAGKLVAETLGHPLKHNAVILLERLEEGFIISCTV